MNVSVKEPEDSCGFSVCHIIQILPTPASGYRAMTALAMYKYGHCKVEKFISSVQPIGADEMLKIPSGPFTRPCTITVCAFDLLTGSSLYVHVIY